MPKADHSFNNRYIHVMDVSQSLIVLLTVAVYSLQTCFKSQYTLIHHTVVMFAVTCRSLAIFASRLEFSTAIPSPLASLQNVISPGKNYRVSIAMMKS